MKNKILVPLTIIFLMVAVTAQAQGILGKIKKKAATVADNGGAASSGSNVSAATPVNTVTSPGGTSDDGFDFKQIPGAKFYFSDKPFTTSSSGARSSFKMDDDVYGRLELGNQTVQQAFNTGSGKGLIKMGIQLNSYNPGEKEPAGGGAGPDYEAYFFVAEKDLKNNFINFDIEPNAAEATTIMTEEIDASPLYGIADEGHFPKKGLYDIKVSLFLTQVDDWGNAVRDRKTWPGSQGAFQFNFDPAGIAEFTTQREQVKGQVAKALLDVSNPLTYVQGAKFFFSDKPFTTSSSGAKTGLTSANFIYARLELQRSLAETFNLNAQSNKAFHYLYYGFIISPKNANSGDFRTLLHNPNATLLIKSGTEKNTYFNFDILGDPAKIPTYASRENPQKLNDFILPSGMNVATDEYEIKTNFPSTGDYRIKVVVWGPAFDERNLYTPDISKHIVTLGEFDYHYSLKDEAKLIDNNRVRFKKFRTVEDD
ncbi:MAG: hypothetical protein WDN26_18205 [Chitinophagaceae bacterium]